MLHKWAFLVLILLLPTQLGLHFWPDFAHVFGIRVDYLSPTIYLSDIVFLTLLLFWVFSRKSTIHLNGSPLLVVIFALFFYLLATSLFVTQNPGAALYKLARFTQVFLLLFYVYHNRLWILVWKPFYSALALSVIYPSLIAFLQFINQKSLGGIFWWFGERSFSSVTPGIALVNIGGQELLRPYGTFSHPNSLAGFILVALILLAPWRGWPKSLALVLGSGAILISFSQTVWFAGFFLGILWLATRKSSLWFRRLAGAAIFGVFLVSFIMLVTNLFIFPFTKLPSLLDREVKQRWELSAVAQRIVVHSPFFGVGLNNFVVRLPEFSQSPSLSWWLQPVHNTLLLLISETGLIGMVLFLYLGVRFLGPVFLDSNPKGTLLLLAILLTGTLDHYWLTLEQNQLLLALVLGLVVPPASKNG